VILNSGGGRRAGGLVRAHPANSSPPFVPRARFPFAPPRGPKDRQRGFFKPSRCARKHQNSHQLRAPPFAVMCVFAHMLHTHTLLSPSCSGIWTALFEALCGRRLCRPRGGCVRFFQRHWLPAAAPALHSLLSPPRNRFCPLFQSPRWLDKCCARASGVFSHAAPRSALSAQLPQLRGARPHTCPLHFSPRPRVVAMESPPPHARGRCRPLGALAPMRLPGPLCFTARAHKNTTLSSSTFGQVPTLTPPTQSRDTAPTPPLSLLRAKQGARLLLPCA
jgi:hypothetical protein